MKLNFPYFLIALGFFGKKIILKSYKNLTRIELINFKQKVSYEKKQVYRFSKIFFRTFNNNFTK